jgi:hypothetical protein
MKKLRISHVCIVAVPFQLEILDESITNLQWWHTQMLCHLNLQLGLIVGWVHIAFTDRFHPQKDLWIAICYVMDSLELTK